MKKKIVSILMVTAMTVSMLAGCGSGGNGDSAANANADAASGAENTASEDGFVIGFANGYWGNTWRAQLVEDFENRCEEYKAEGIIADYMVSNTNADATEQLNQINAMIDAGVDAIIINAASPTALTSAVQKALDKNILVVMGSDPAAYEGTYCVCGSDVAWQSIFTKWLCEKMGGQGNIVQITGTPGVSTDTLRQEASAAVLAEYPGITQLASMPGSWSQTEAQSVMTTFLSTYDNIDGVLTQDVMAEGIIKAFDNAGKEPCLMTGDYVKSFFTLWSEMEGFESIGVPYACGMINTVLDVTVGLLQGEELDESKLQPNPMDESLVNAILLDPPYVVTLEGEQDAPWMEGLPNTQAITLDEALELLKDAPDTASLDGWMSKEEVLENYFK